jgi:hypothetical protein
VGFVKVTGPLSSIDGLITSSDMRSPKKTSPGSLPRSLQSSDPTSTMTSCDDHKILINGLKAASQLGRFVSPSKAHFTAHAE